MTNYIYIHGLNSSKESSKYKTLQKNFSNISILEWSIDSNINLILDDFVSKVKATDDKIILIGDSTGGNLACQLRDRLSELNIYTGLVLLNPLLNRDSLVNQNIMPDNILKNIKTIPRIKDALLIISNNDEVVDNSKLTDYIKDNTYIIRINDVHKLYTLENYIKDIKNYAENIYL